MNITTLHPHSKKNPKTKPFKFLLVYVITYRWLFPAYSYVPTSLPWNFLEQVVSWAFCLLPSFPLGYIMLRIVSAYSHSPISKQAISKFLLTWAVRCYIQFYYFKETNIFHI